MPHVLDNPIWHALTGPQADLAIGRGAARRYPRDIAAFSAIAGNTPEAYNDLAADLPLGVEARVLCTTDEPALPGWETISSRQVVQMVADDLSPFNTTLPGAPEPLTEADVDQMVALVELTKPGPFDRRTYLLGGYAGYRDGTRLTAMGGERFRLPGFAEISAICAHPSVRGKGFGAAMTWHLAHRVLARGETPFLHAFADNPAINLYRQLGFRERARLWFIWRRPVSREAC